MKKLILGGMFGLLLVAMPSVAFDFKSDLQAAGTMFSQLSIDPTSVQVISAVKQAQDLYRIDLAFQILPSNSCQESYAGLFEKAHNDYTVVYLTSLDGRCKMYAQPRRVTHAIMVNFYENSRAPNSVILQLNNVNYRLTLNEDGRVSMGLKS